METLDFHCGLLEDPCRQKHILAVLKRIQLEGTAAGTCPFHRLLFSKDTFGQRFLTLAAQWNNLRSLKKKKKKANNWVLTPKTDLIDLDIRNFFFYSSPGDSNVQPMLKTTAWGYILPFWL